MIHFEVEGIDGVLNGLMAAKNELSFGVVRGIAEGCRDGADEAKRTHRYKDRTGKLTASISGGLTMFLGDMAEGQIVATAPYASYVDGGTRAHIIRPKLARGTVGPVNEGQTRRKRGEGKARVMLRWVGADGRVHFKSFVKHKGTRPDGFMGTAYLKAERVIIRAIEESVPHAQAALDR